MEEDYFIEPSLLREVDSPALLVYKKVVETNIGKIGNILGSYASLRPHVKTDKIAEVVRMLQARNVDKFKCATIAEAEMLGMAKAGDVLLAYQPNEVKAGRLFALSSAYPDTRFSCLVDNTATFSLLNGMWKGKRRFPVYLDMNVGMDRTGVAPDKVMNLFREGLKYDRIRMVGLHVYDGHINDGNPEIRSRRAEDIFEVVYGIKLQIEGMYATSLNLVMGGSPTFKYYNREAVRLDDHTIEVSPGTFTFWDAGYRDLLADLPFSPAAVLFNRVLSIVDDNLICIDLGYKAVASENPLARRMVFLNVPGGIPLEQSEEHLTIRVPDGSGYKVGDPIYSIPWHVCPTVALYESVYVVEGKKITGKWAVVARDRKIKY